MNDISYDDMFALADILGVRTAPIDDDFNRGSSRSRPQWDGTTVWFDPDDGAADLFHELVHWVVAEPVERAAWDFGLGPSSTFRTFRDGTNPLMTTVDGRAAWVNQLLLPLPVAGQRESDACHTFLLLPNVVASAEQADAIEWWGLYGGDFGLKFTDDERAVLDRTLDRLAGRLRGAGVTVSGEPAAVVDEIWTMFASNSG